MSIGIGYTDKPLSENEVAGIIKKGFANIKMTGKSILLIVPDSTRTAPVAQAFNLIYKNLADKVAKLDVVIALGTHPPMTDKQINKRMGINQEERNGKYKKVTFHNHLWQNPESLKHIGTIPASEINKLSDGLFSMDVKITVNKLIFDYDYLCIVGPVFPHEVVGFSGGNKYLFPGISGKEIIDFFHWLGAIITNPKIIGNKHTPVRAVLNKAAEFVKVKKLCLAMVVTGHELAGAYFGSPEGAWSDAADLSGKLHIIYCDKPFQTVLSCAPPMYDDLWTGGKCMYKLESVVADGGELIIYAPHIKETSITHGEVIEKIGYHTKSYFVKQWDKFKHEPWGIIAHSTHVRGIGSYENKEEKCRIMVTLATGIPEEICTKINMGYRNPNSINVESFKNCESKGILYVKKAGEMLYKLKNPPTWQIV